MTTTKDDVYFCENCECDQVCRKEHDSHDTFVICGYCDELVAQYNSQEDFV